MMKRTLKAGTIVYVCGSPVELDADVEVNTFDGNWPLIQYELSRPAPTNGPLPTFTSLTSVGGEAR